MKFNKKTAFRYTTAALVGAVLASSAGVSYGISGKNSFTDVPSNHWAYSSIQKAAANNWVSGVGNNKYNPNGKVTAAEWYTMVVRAMFKDDVPKEPRKDAWFSGEWYSPYVQVSERYGFSDSPYDRIDTKEELNRPITRRQMAVVVSQVLAVLNKNADYTEMEKAVSKIPDVSTDTASWYDIMNAYNAGILTGVDDKGTFDPEGSMDRSQAAAVLCRIKEVAENKGNNQNSAIPNQGNSTESENTPVEPETPAPSQPSAGSSSGAVGTLSDSPVNLSYATHKPVVDYWSDAPSAVQAKTDQEVYNALVQTLKDREIAGQNRKEIGPSFRNPYYNYPVYLSVGFEDKEKRNKQVTVLRAINETGLAREGFFKLGASSPSETYWDVKVNPEDFDGYSFYKPYLDQITPSMSDKEAAVICMRAVTDKFSYGPKQGFNFWDDENPSDMCEGLSVAASQVFGAAGIPTIMNATSKHTWTYALLDGEWYVVDATLAEHGAERGNTDPNFWIDSVEKYESEELSWSTVGGLNDPGSMANIAKTILEQAGVRRK